MAISISSCGLRAYLLKIALPFERGSLVNKIKELIAFDAYNNKIFIEFISEVPNDVFYDVMRDIMLEFNKFRILLLGVVDNENSKQFSVDDQYKLLLKDFNIPLVNLSNDKPSNHIHNTYNTSSPKPQQMSSSILFIDEPVRNGVRIEHDGDIVISNIVSDHAEVIARGSILVYGSCRGKLIAGHSHNTNARIIMYHFIAELVSIAGLYKIVDRSNSPEFGECVKITTDGINLKFEKI